MSQRVSRTVFKWSEDASKHQIPFLLSYSESVANNNYDLLTKLLPDSYAHSFSVNQTKLPSLIPLAALNEYTLAAADRGHLMLTEQINGTFFFHSSLHSWRTYWVWCQLTWAPLLSRILLELDQAVSADDRTVAERFFWLLDYDVTFTGDISELIFLTSGEKSDFLAKSQVTFFSSFLSLRVHFREETITR